MSRVDREPLQHSGLFFDSANLELLEKWYKTGTLGGATTNPVILRKDNITNIPQHIQKMVEITGPGFPISIEIPDSRWEKEQMISMALWYRDRFRDNAVIKVPMDPSNSSKAFEVMHALAAEGVRLNATLGLSSGQLIAASEAMRNSKADGDNYVSLFWARREEAQKQMKTDNEGVQIPGAAETLVITLKYLETHSLATRIIVGSIRNPQQIEMAFNSGADIVTIPPALLEEWMKTQRGAETAKEFNDAYLSVEKEIILTEND